MEGDMSNKIAQAVVLDELPQGHVPFSSKV